MIAPDDQGAVMTRSALRWGVLSLAVFGAACGSGGAAQPPVDGGSNVDSSGPTTDGGGPVVAAPDLRFKWVGAGLKLHLDAVMSSELLGAITSAGPGGVTPLELSGDELTYYGLFSSPDLEPMVVIVATGDLPDVVPDLDQLLDARTIVVSLDTSFEQDIPNPSGIYIAALSGSQSGVMYRPYNCGTTTAAGLADWLATQTSPGEVATALGPTADGIFITAFGRDGDSTSYETQVVTATLDDLVSQLEGLAADGYVITALGRDGTGTYDASNFVAVGTRAPGQTAARTIKAVDQPCGGPDAGSLDAPVQPLFDDGYALIGAVFHDATSDCNGEPSWLFIGER
jgi:hypothetical protein